jgi:acylaminoacyl-peptidase
MFCNSGMYNELSAVPLPTTAQFISPSSIRITFTVRDHVRNIQRTLAKVVSLPDLNPTGFEEVSSEVISTLTSPSQSFRAVLRDTKSSRFVEIWTGDSRLVACKDVTALHGQFYSDRMYPFCSSCPMAIENSTP